MSMPLNGTSQYLYLPTPLVSADPIFACGWVKPASVTGDHVIAALSSETVSLQIKNFYTSGTAIRLQDFAGASGGFASLASAVATSTWQFFAGLWGSSTSRTVYSGASSASNATSKTPGSLGNTTIGVQKYLNGSTATVDTFFSGKLAHVAFWSTDQSANIAALRAGTSPSAFPSGLLSYMPLTVDFSDTKGNSWTAIGSPTIDDTDNPTMLGSFLIPLSRIVNAGGIGSGGSRSRLVNA